MPDPLPLLLDIQHHDLTADQLRHRRVSLPERTVLAEQEAAVGRLDVELSEMRARMLELQRSQKRLEDEVATLQAKAEGESTRMYSGLVNTPRELQALQQEIDGLTRRQRGMEDEVLDLMESSELLGAETDRIERLRDSAGGEADRLMAAIAEAESSIDAELADVASAREGLIAGLAPDLLATYERLRSQLGGIAVARLDGTQCSGCHLSLPATELDAVRRAAPGTLVLHEECGRILVR